VANAIPFQLITPLSVKFDGYAELVIAVGTEGEVGILPSHAPYLTALRPGVLRANVQGAAGPTERLELACGEGFLQALPRRTGRTNSGRQRPPGVAPRASKDRLRQRPTRRRGSLTLAPSLRNSSCSVIASLSSNPRR
jgi:hypothetical protein